jgi:hypothetical protein
MRGIATPRIFHFHEFCDEFCETRLACKYDHLKNEYMSFLFSLLCRFYPSLSCYSVFHLSNNTKSLPSPIHLPPLLPYAPPPSSPT